MGGSTLDPKVMRGLYYRNEIGGVIATRPYGLGPRVPLYVISPWSRGGWVCSQVFDHTSTIRFIEARFGVSEPNISPWHRAISGDLTSCFDFTRTDDEPLADLPDVSHAKGETLVIADLPRVELPREPFMPSQDPGVRCSRALPYRLAVHASPNLETESLDLRLENTGEAGAVLHVYDRLQLKQPPHRYTLEAAKVLTASWPTHKTDGRYDLHIMGPNGLLWRFTGRLPAQSAETPLPEVRLKHDPELQAIGLEVWNSGDQPCEIETRPNIYRSDRAHSLTVMPASPPTEVSWPVHASGFWYDFSVICPSLPEWSRRFAGRLETGKHGITDPALGGFETIDLDC